MRAYRFLSLCIAILLPLQLLLGMNSYCAAQASSLWQKANSYYQQKQYDSALSCYRQIAATGKVNAGLFYNTANAYYRLNRIGSAVLYYEKALRLEPDNKMIADNLLLAKKRIDNPVAEVPPVFFERWWHGLLHAAGTNGWAVILLTLFCGTVALIYLSIAGKIRYSGRWIAFSSSLLLLTGLITFFSYQDAVNSGRAVVMAANTSLLDTPKPGSKISSNIPEGTTVKLIQENGTYVNVELPNGRRGWVSSSMLEKI